VPDDVFELTIIDISGKIIHKEKITQQIFDLDASMYQPGLYIVNASGIRKIYTKKLIVN
jgi:hypothetical protein